jgi:hypothetical protein
MSKNARTVMGLVGPLCRRCGIAMQVREHKTVTEKMLRQSYYFSRWYRCGNEKCVTGEVVVEQFKVYVRQPDLLALLSDRGVLPI